MKRGALALALLLSWSAPAAADNVEQAKTYFTAGAAAFDKGDFATAIQAFEKAQELAPRPAILFSLAQAHRKQFAFDGDVRHAVVAVGLYRDYLKAVPQGGRSGEARDALEQLAPVADRAGSQTAAPQKKEPARVSIASTGTPGALIALDGSPPTESPLTGPVTPGRHTLVISADGFFDEKKEITAVEGTIVALDVPLREKPAKIQIKAPPGARVDVDGRTAGTTPLAALLEVPAGVHILAIGKNGRGAYLRELELTRGEVSTLDAALPGSGQRTLAMALLVTGAVGVAVGVATMAIALEREAAAKSILDRTRKMNVPAPDLASYDSARSARDAASTISIASFAAAGAVAAVGVALFLFDPPNMTGAAQRERKAPPPAPTKSLSLTVSPFGGSVGGTF